MKKKKSKQKVKVAYREDNGETVYSMASLEGLTPEEAERRAEEKKRRVKLSRKEKGAMIRAAYSVYGKILLIFIGSFALVAVILYLLLK